MFKLGGNKTKLLEACILRDIYKEEMESAQKELGELRVFCELIFGTSHPEMYKEGY